MNITQEKVSDLNSILRVKLGPVDYQQRVDTQLKELQRKASMPGFRPGKVPFGMVKKMYGKSVLSDEVNKVLNNSVTEFISSNKIEIIGQPIPALNQNDKLNWDTQQEFEFAFELGHAPEFNVEIEQEPFEYKMIKVEDALIDKEIEDMQRRYGKVTNPEQVEKNDLVFGDFIELDSDGNELENGIKKTSTIATDKIKSEQALASLIGLNKGNHLVVDPHDLSSNATDLAGMLGVTPSQAESMSSNFRFTITNISRVQPAELNEELYNKVYGDSVNSIEEFRAKIKGEMSNMFNADSDKYFLTRVVAGLVKKHDIQLPEDFLKRWLLFVNEKEINATQIDKEFPVYAERLRTQMVINKIIRQNGIEVKEQDIRDFVKDLVSKQFASYNGTEMEESDLDDTVNRVLKNEKEYNRIVEKMYDDKLLELLKSKLKLNFTEVSFEDFYHQN
jgi:trigger factor